MQRQKFRKYLTRPINSILRELDCGNVDGMQVLESCLVEFYDIFKDAKERCVDILSSGDFDIAYDRFRKILDYVKKSHDISWHESVYEEMFRIFIDLDVIEKSRRKVRMKRLRDMINDSGPYCSTDFKGHKYKKASIEAAKLIVLSYDVNLGGYNAISNTKWISANNS